MWVWWAPHGRTYAEADEHLASGLEDSSRVASISGASTSWHIARAPPRPWPLGRGGRRGQAVVDDQRSSPMPRIVALSVLGLVRADPGPRLWLALDEAWRLASPTASCSGSEPAAAARAEAAWLEGRPELVSDDVASALALAGTRHGLGRRRARLLAVARRQSRVGSRRRESVRAPADRPLEEAAERWTELGSPYEAALALADGDEAAQRRAHEELTRMGARPAAGIVARRLRQQGARESRVGPSAARSRALPA